MIRVHQEHILQLNLTTLTKNLYHMHLHLQNTPTNLKITFNISLYSKDQPNLEPYPNTLRFMTMA